MNSLNRRSVLLAGLGAAGTGVLAACSSNSPSSPSLVSPSGSQVTRTEKKRAGTGKVHRLNLTAAPAVLDLGGGTTARSWAFSGQAPGKEIRISAGDTLAAKLSNQLPDKTPTPSTGTDSRCAATWTASRRSPTAVRAGASFTYRFIADAPGTSGMDSGSDDSSSSSSSGHDMGDMDGMDMGGEGTGQDSPSQPHCRRPAVRPSTTMRLRRGSVHRLLGLRCGAVVLVQVHTRLLLIGGSMTARHIHSNIPLQEGTRAGLGLASQTNIAVGLRHHTRATQTVR